MTENLGETVAHFGPGVAHFEPFLKPLSKRATADAMKAAKFEAYERQKEAEEETKKQSRKQRGMMLTHRTECECGASFWTYKYGKHHPTSKRHLKYLSLKK